MTESHRVRTLGHPNKPTEQRFVEPPGFHIIVATDLSGGIGKQGSLPWHFSSDMKHFRHVTMQTKDSQRQNAVIMGYQTWTSIPEKFRPLSNRHNIILSRQTRNLGNHVSVCSSFDQALQTALYQAVEQIYVIGGAQIYALALRHRHCGHIWLTKIDQDFACDTFFPTLSDWDCEQTAHIVEKETALDFFSCIPNRNDS